MSPRLRNNVTFRASAWVMLVLLLLAPFGLTRLHLDNGLAQWVASESDRDRAEQFKSDFGDDDFVLLAYEADDLFSIEALELQGAVLDVVETIPGVRSVLGLPVLFREHFGSEDPEALRAEMDQSPFYDRLLVSPDRTMAGMVIGCAPDLTGPERRALVDALYDAALPMEDGGWSVYLAGPTVLNAALDRASQRESARVLPAAVALSLAVLLVFLRSARKVIVAGVVSAAVLVATLGLMGLMGLTMNMVTIALPPVLWVLSMAYVVHLLRYHETALLAGLAPRDALARAVEAATRPCLISALTTALGFLSLRTASLEPVRELGAAGALGMPVAFVAALGLGPLLINVLGITATVDRHRGARLETPPLSARRPSAVVIAVALLVVLSGAFALRIRVESNPLSFLDPDSRIARDCDRIASHFTGLYTLDTVLELPGLWTDPANWPSIDRQAEALASTPGMARVLSPLDYLRKAAQWQDNDPDAYRLPENQEEAARLVDELPETARQGLDGLVSSDGRRVRLMGLVRVMDGGALLDIVSLSTEALAGAPGGVAGYHAGLVLRLVRAQFDLIRTQVESLGLALIVVFACVWIGLRSTRLMIFSIGPNVVPLAGLFGLMGLCGIPLDPATVMIAAIAVGIAVDDTLHLLISWRERFEDGEAPAEALAQAGAVNLPAMVATALTAGTGFLALGLSDFAPIRYFGLLSAATLLLAVAADYWLLPATIHLTLRKKGENV